MRASLWTGVAALCLGVARRLTTVAETEKPFRRSWPFYALGAVLVIGMGLFWRSGILPLSSVLAKYGGDSLWALLVFLGFGFAFSRSSTLRIVLIAVCFAWSIEFLQLYHAPWIDLVRSTRVGRSILGSTFNSPDLLAYVVGIAFGAFAERGHLNASRGVNPKVQL